MAPEHDELSAAKARLYEEKGCEVTVNRALHPQHIFMKLKCMNNDTVPEAMQVLYCALLQEGCKVLSCKKKWFRDHWVIKVGYPENSMDYEVFHLTPEKIWWECIY